MNLKELDKALKKLRKEELIELLDSFMSGKQRIIENLVKNCSYWINDDTNLLKRFDKVTLREGLKCIIVVTGFPYVIKPFTCIDCPFCIILNKECYVCPYGQKKGLCSDSGSEFDYITEEIDAYCLNESLHDDLRNFYERWHARVIQFLYEKEAIS